MLLNLRMDMALNFIKDGKIVATVLDRLPDLDTDIYWKFKYILDAFYMDDIKNITDITQRIIKTIESIGGRLYDENVREVQENGCKFDEVDEFRVPFVVIASEQIEEINNNHSFYTYAYNIDEEKLELSLCMLDNIDDFAYELYANETSFGQACYYDDIPVEECAKHLVIVPTLDYTLPEKYYGIVEFPYNSDYVGYKDLENVLKYLSRPENMLKSKDGTYIYINA